MDSKATILIVDDDPLHLQLYGMILEKAGFTGLPVLVSYAGMDFPDGVPVDAALVDYRLGPNVSAYSAVQRVKERYPSAPILILSDMYDPPADTAPLVQGFVRKGNPEKLLSALHDLIHTSAPEYLETHGNP
ncbi:MAG: response regulator [Terracidiphilus sp.]